MFHSNLLQLPREEFSDLARCLGLSQLFKAYLFRAFRVGRMPLRLPDRQRIVVDASQLPWILLNIAHIYCYEDYEFVEEVKPRKGWMVVDVGAYVGVYTLKAARRVGSKGRVVALEPHPASFRLLKHNVELNHLENVKLLPYALASSKGRRKLYSPRYRANASLNREYAELWDERLEAFEVECFSLVDLLDLLSIDRVDLLKLDVEGAELEILEASGEALKRIERLVIETHLDICSFEKLERLLVKYGFTVSMKFDELAPNQAFLAAVRYS